MEHSPFVTIVLPFALAIIMLSLGTALTVDDFRRVVLYPRGVAIGLANLLVLSPLLAFAVAELFGLDPALAVGLVLLGASPGGTLANLLTHLARGDTALSITLTATSSIAAVVSVPLYLKIATSHFGDSALDTKVGVVGLVARVLLITVIPVGLGMWFRHRRPERVEELGGALRAVSIVVFLGAVVGVIVAEQDRVIDNLGAVGAAVVTLNLAAMAGSFTISRLARLDSRQATAVAMELGIHNSTLAIAIGATVATVLTIPAAVYATFAFIPAGLFAWFMHNRNAAGAPAPWSAELSK